MGKNKDRDNKRDDKPSVGQAIRDLGPTITAKELGRIQEQYGSKAVEKAQDYAKDTPGVSLNQQARAYTPPAAPVTPPPVTKSDVRNYIENKDFGANIGAKDLRAIENKFGAQGVALAQSIAKNSNDYQLNSNARDFYKDFVTRTTTTTSGDGTTISGDGTTISGDGTIISGDGNYTIPSGYVSLTTANLATQAANLQIQREIAKLEQDGATERTKYEVDNRIPLVEAESKGKLDLQKIVNSGYKEIAQIERGAKMMANITSMFNF